VLNERQRKAPNRLLDAGPDGFAGGMNTRKYMGLTKTSRATAYRELADLVEKGCLRPTGQGGRSSGVVAVVAFDGFGIAAQTLNRIQHDKTIVIKASDVPVHQAALASVSAYRPRICLSALSAD
jgi:hypothetical protein